MTTKASNYLQVGQVYSRRMLRSLFRIADDAIEGPIFRPMDFLSLWLFVTEHSDPSSLPCGDILKDDVLYWGGFVRGHRDHLLVDHAKLNLEILVFYRRDRQEHFGGGFRYEGPFEYVFHSGIYPRHFVFCRASAVEKQAAVAAEDEFREGAKLERLSSFHERNPKLRAAAIAIHGTICMTCGFDFEAAYGPHGAGYIEVHHLKPLSTLQRETKVNPLTDMIVVCANCHRMIHRRRDRLLSPDETRALLLANKLTVSPG